MTAIRLMLCGLALMCPLLAGAAGFDCGKARKPVEKMICADPALSRQDDELVAAYRLALDKSVSRAAVKEWQRHWLASGRGECQDAACLRQAYQDHLQELAQHVQASAAGDAYSGVYRRYLPGGKPDTDAAELTVIALSGRGVRIMGSAIWSGAAGAGNTNVGMVDGVAALRGTLVHYLDPETECRFTLGFAGDGLTIRDENAECGGMNVTFKGTYRKR